ncbi:MAG: SDR family oxidoreductase [Deltaproteobacteria bacterium]|nr:SDR family oxidoreductase [Deltaproteobacteria bacterium]
MGKNVVITGANRGIGLSLCKYYQGRGDSVYGVCRQVSPELRAVAEVIVDGVDISREEDCARLQERLSGVGIDLLINNAGILNNERLGQLDFDSITRQLQVNAVGALRVTESLLANLTGNAKVAIITSRMGSIADNSSGSYYGYRMSKAALNAAGKSLAMDLSPRGIAVAILHPGLVGTEMIGGAGDITPDEAAGRLAARIDGLSMANTGTFWHANGDELPW